MSPYRLSILPPLVFACLFTACGTVPPAAPLPLPPPPETGSVSEAPVPRLPDGIRLFHEGRELSLAEFEGGTLPVDATITLQADRNVSYEVITGMLTRIHAQGYLVQFSTAD